MLLGLWSCLLCSLKHGRPCFLGFHRMACPLLCYSYSLCKNEDPGWQEEMALKNLCLFHTPGLVVCIKHCVSATPPQHSHRLSAHTILTATLPPTCLLCLCLQGTEGISAFRAVQSTSRESMWVSCVGVSGVFWLRVIRDLHSLVIA